MQKALSRLDGVESVTANLEEARVDIRLKENQLLKVEELRKTVIKAGFTPTWIRFNAVGHLVKVEGEYKIRVKGTEQIIPLVSSEKLKALQEALGNETKLISVVIEIPNGEQAAQIQDFQIL